MKKIVLLLGIVIFPLNSLADVISGSHTEAAGSRSYQLYVPDSASSTEPLPLIVMLHGCFQTGSQFSQGTGMNAKAEELGFYVLYPEQSYSDNVWKCWNWFEQSSLTRGQGEISIIAGMVKKISDEYSIAPKKIFASGLSAGGAMASNLVGCYSDIFSGTAIHSGLKYRAAITETEAHQVLKSGSTRPPAQTGKSAYECSPIRENPVRVMTIHGSSDNFVTPLNSDHVIQQAMMINDWIDDQEANQSSQYEITESRIEPTALGNYGASVTKYRLNGTILYQKIMVENMAHAWSGGKPIAPYMDSRGIDATTAIVNFFLHMGE